MHQVGTSSLLIYMMHGHTYIKFAWLQVLKFCCRINLWFRLMGGLQAKSMTSQRYRAVTRWRICVIMATLWQQQDGGYALLWKRYDTVHLLLDVYTELVIDVFYIFNSTVIDWTSYFFYQNCIKVNNIHVVTKYEQFKLWDF